MFLENYNEFSVRGYASGSMINVSGPLWLVLNSDFCENTSVSNASCVQHGIHSFWNVVLSMIYRNELDVVSTAATTSAGRRRDDHSIKV